MLKETPVSSTSRSSKFRSNCHNKWELKLVVINPLLRKAIEQVKYSAQSIFPNIYLHIGLSYKTRYKLYHMMGIITLFVGLLWEQHYIFMCSLGHRGAVEGNYLCWTQCVIFTTFSYSIMWCYNKWNNCASKLCIPTSSFYHFGGVLTSSKEEYSPAARRSTHQQRGPTLTGSEGPEEQQGQEGRAGPGHAGPLTTINVLLCISFSQSSLRCENVCFIFASIKS